METDIVERLRDLDRDPDRAWVVRSLAADEIERLRTELSEIREFIGTADAIRFEMLNAAGDEIERLRVICAAMDDPSRTSKFEYGITRDGSRVPFSYGTIEQANETLGEPGFEGYHVVTRTVTYTAWRPAAVALPEDGE